MTVFTASFSAVAIAAEQDLFELVAPANARVRILEIDIGQYTDFGDAAAEIIPLTMFRGHTVSGSGGTTVTPTNVSTYSRAAGAVVEANNTTVATTAGSLLWATAWHIQAGFIWRQPEDVQPYHRRQILLAPDERFVIRVGAPADSITTNGTVMFEEIHKGATS